MARKPAMAIYEIGLSDQIRRKKVKKKLFIFVVLAVMLILVAGCGPGSVIQVNTPVPNTQASTPVPNGQINVPGVSIQIYAPSPNPLAHSADAHGRVAGILHCFIAAITSKTTWNCYITTMVSTPSRGIYRVLRKYLNPNHRFFCFLAATVQIFMQETVGLKVKGSRDTF